MPLRNMKNQKFRLKFSFVRMREDGTEEVIVPESRFAFGLSAAQIENIQSKNHSADIELDQVEQFINQGATANIRNMPRRSGAMLALVRSFNEALYEE